MAGKGIFDQIIAVVDKTFDALGEVTSHVLDKIEGEQESQASSAEEIFEPTPGYRPDIGDKVAIKPTDKVLTGHVSKIHSGCHPMAVVYCEGEHEGEQELWTVDWNSIKLIERFSNGNPAQQTSGPMEAYYEQRLRRAEGDAQKVSQQHQDFVDELRIALHIGTTANTSFTENDVLNLVKSRLSTLGIILKRLGTQDSIAAIRAVEDLMGQR